MYKYKIVSSTNSYINVEFSGPGLSKFSMKITFLNRQYSEVSSEAEEICRLLSSAFEEGKKQRSREIVNLLGINDWK